MPADYPVYPSRDQMRDCLEGFAKHFGLYDHITFSMSVVSMTTRGLDGWTVQTDDGEVRGYDAVPVANGHLTDPYVPSIAADFTGRSLHSHRYDSIADVEGNREWSLTGHGGSVPGFLASLWVSPADDVGAVVLCNSTGRVAISTLAADLVGIVAEREPRIPAPWKALDPALLEIAGPWYWGPSPLAIRVGAGRELELTGLAGRARATRRSSPPPSPGARRGYRCRAGRSLPRS